MKVVQCTMKANSYNETDNSSPDFQLPDWGFLQRPYSETELQEEEEASSSRVRERPPINNPFFYLKLQKNDHLKNSAMKTKTINIKV